VSNNRKSPPRGEEIQSLVKGFAVLKAFGPETPRLTLTEVARATGLTRAGARRVLLTLKSLDYVTNDDRYFRLQPRVLELGYTYLAAQPWWRVAQTVVERLAEELDNPVAAGVIDTESAIYLAHARPQRFKAFVRSVGTRLPMGTSAMGRVLLAHLPESEQEVRLAKASLVPLTKSTITDLARLRHALSEIRRSGYSLVDQELEVGLRSMALPIIDRGGHVSAAIGISTSDPDLTANSLVKRYLSVLQKAATEISLSFPS
jgi:IclR family pca regulon transcriptional regulator